MIAGGSVPRPGCSRARPPGTVSDVRRSGRLLLAGLLTMLCLAVAVGAHQLYVRMHPYLLGSGCAVRTADGSMALDIEQAANAATIAAVGLAERLPARAVTIALAAAFQESQLRNLPYGDRDSVGLFQQRPSQGWGTASQILDPVYASQQFYDALAEVEEYLELPLHVAAQRVQRSADGTAYARHEKRAEVLAKALTGGDAAALHCWYPDERPARTEAALRELARSFRSVSWRGAEVSVANEQHGWAVAAWMVAHAHEYGIPGVRYNDRAWRAVDGHDGWRDAEARTPARIVRIS